MEARGTSPGTITKEIDGVTFGLSEDFDFGFLSEYGTVFAVFDQQDSGYLSFGVQGERGKLFLKMAGAATIQSKVSIDEAIHRLQSTVPIYEELRHPLLIDMIEHKEIAGGYLTVFEWFDGVCMGKQYNAHHQFLALPLHEKNALYYDILRFHRHTNECGYVAIDFYDGSIMYDFAQRQTRICDIELYAKKPFVNTMGRMWGSSRFMSPEEFQLGAEIDERSNVYVMGATAFQLFGGGTDRSIDKWQGTQEQYIAALRAVSTDKNERYPTIDEYMKDWAGSGEEVTP